ncbi:MAG: FHA domain-containing protein [Solirubrobacterales bacterium]
MLTDKPTDLHESGENVPGFASVGSLACTECGYAVAAAAVLEDLPRCPACGGTSFRRRSLFARPTVDAAAVTPASSQPRWLAGLRTGDTPCLAFDADSEQVVAGLEMGWTRIGRSAAADVRLDDPTVSRRHALIVRTDDEGLRALDDRSLNGLFVNGERVEWARLADGDELEIGCYRLYVVVP